MFVLTPEETKAICFVLVAFVIGIGTKHYRDTHRPAVTSAAAAAQHTARRPTAPRKQRSHNPSPTPVIEREDEPE